MTSSNAADARGAESAPLPEQLEALELALKGLFAIGEALVAAPRTVVDLRPIARAVEAAVGGALDAYDGRRETVASLYDAVAACESVLGGVEEAVRVDEGLAPVREWLRISIGWLRKALAAPSTGRAMTHAPLVASVGVPSLHRVQRASIRPAYQVSAPVAPPRAPPPVDPSSSLAERSSQLRARAAARREAAEGRRAAQRSSSRLARRPEEEARPGFVAGPHTATPPESAIRDRARLCFEEVAGLGMMRAPQTGDAWRAMAVLDQRMLSAVDAVVALGPSALGCLEALVTGAPAKDPTRGFAIAMIAGALEGRDALGVVERALRYLGVADREVIAAVADGLALAPHPDIGPVLGRWLTDEEPMMRALAVDVLARRGLLGPAQLASALGDAEAEVVARALVPSALARVPELAGRVEELLGHSHAELGRQLAWAMVLGDVPFAVSRLCEWLGGAREEAALLPLALAGERSDVERIVALASAKATPERLAAVGFSGAPEAVPVLIGVLRTSKDDELKLAASRALLRITGAPLWEDVEVPPEQIEAADPEEPDDPFPPKEPLGRRLDPRDLPAEPAPETAVVPSLHAARWEDWLAGRAGDGEPAPRELPAEKRHRGGKPYTPAISLGELDADALPSAERRVLHYELVLKTGEAHPFDPRAFVPQQEAALARWASAADRASSQPGSWGRARRR